MSLDGLPVGKMGGECSQRDQRVVDIEDQTPSQNKGLIQASGKVLRSEESNIFQTHLDGLT
jgi:hypothetical protein